MNSYIKSYSDKLKRNLNKISESTARIFLLKNGYALSSFSMPDYYNPMFSDSIRLDKITWAPRDLPKITKTLDVLTPKGNMSWRSFNFLHPYIFFHIVEELTDKQNWAVIKNILTKENYVHSYSTPVLKTNNGRKSQAEAILNWIQMAERDIIKDCAGYNYLTITDIANFYPTIYTHSIAWAIHGRKIMKISKNRRNFKLLGNKLDKLFQNSRDGQTNGVPVGSMVSDIIAEIILTDVDCKLSKIIKSRGLSNHVLICRYRDDYRILSRDKDHGKEVLQELNRILYTEYDLHLNHDKTNTYDDVIENTFRPWILEINNSHLLRKIKYGDLSDCSDSRHVKDCLLEIYRIQKKSPRSGAAITIITKLAEGLDKKSKKIKLKYSDIPEIISILRRISLLRAEVTPYVFSLLDILLEKIKTKGEKKRILKAIKGVISGKNDRDYQLIWFYRLCLSQLPEMCEDLIKSNNAPLLSIVSTNYKHDYKIFDKIKLSKNDRRELKKFLFIDRRKLKKSASHRIEPNSINIFRYVNV